MSANDLTETAIQGMMMGEWKRGAQIAVGNERVAVCLDGEVWEIQDRNERVLGTVNPTVAVDSEEIRHRLKTVGPSQELCVD